MKKFKIFMGVVLTLLALTLGIAVFFFFQYRNAGGFVKGTVVCGRDVTGLMPEDIMSYVDSEYSGFDISVVENGQAVIEGSAGDYGYIYDHAAAEAELNEKFADQKNNFFIYYSTQILGSELVLHKAYRLDDHIFKSYVNGNNMSVPRVPSCDASFRLNEDGTEYVIADATTGNEISDKILQKNVRERIEEHIRSGKFSESLTVEVPKEAYISVPGSNDKRELVKALPQKNKELKLENTFGKMNITYLFGNKKQVLSGNEILSWVSYGPSDRIVVDQDKIEEYVELTAGDYDTLWRARQFKTTSGRKVSVDSAHNAYGYRINQEKECAQLKKDILAAKSVTREPIYDGEGAYGNPLYLSRNGQDDLNGTYVEVSIGEQHVWFYKDGKLVTEGDCVTGRISNGHGTIPGAYPLAYKQKSRVLRGGTGAGAYESFVNYWMPFNLGQGLHDASWRGKFGGNIYYNRGSHGCVNLPLKIAKSIFENIDVGTAIIVYN